jgi:formylglycine-generating enzyme
MESIVQSLAVLVAALAVLLFFGPIIVIISIIGNIKLGPLSINVSNSKTFTRILLALVGLGVWLVVYIPLVSLAYRSINPFTSAMQLTATPTQQLLVTETPTRSETSDVDITELPSPIPPVIPEVATPSPEVLISEMVRIPQGTFKMGSSYTSAYDFNPSHDVFISEFYIDKYEVTNAQYHKCVDVGICSKPFLWSSNTRTNYYDDLALYGNYPVVYVTWTDAQTFCAWRNARLPTEAEWEKASRWNPEDGKTTLFPWGNENPDFSRVNFHSKDTNAVGSYPSGQSHLGVFDMAGNVLEWVFDYYSPTFYEVSPVRDPSGPFIPTDSRVARGGAWTSSKISNLWSFSRYYFSEDVARNDLGFRCASDSAP